MGKKKHEEHENHERWIIPYADMVTLLFAFFVVMYAISQQDIAKLKNVSKSVSEAFLGTAKGGPSLKKIELSENKNPPEMSSRFVVRRATTNQEIIDELRKQLTQEGFDFVYQDKQSPIQIKIDSRGVIISISAGYLFDPNSTEVKPELYPVISIISEVLKSNRRLILVEGHTDNTPTVGNVYYSNWELSALRATSMVRTLIEQFGIEASRLSAVGHGSNRPLADNNTPEGQAQNRRVEIIMLNASEFDTLLEDESVPR